MKASKKFWSLLLALVMVVSLMSGAFVVGAADEAIAITPDATYGGEALTMTATGVGDKLTKFDLASIGFGTGIEYALWFDADGTFSFDKDVTLTYQGVAADELKAGEVYTIAGGNWSEKYVALDDGNMLMILDAANPGNFAGLTPDMDLADFPGTVSGAEAAPAEEAPAEEAPAAEGEAFAAASELKAGSKYMIVTFADGKAYALAAKSGAPAAVEVTADDATAIAPDDSVVWIPNATDNLESAAAPGYYIFASSGGFMLWDASMLRTFTYDAATGIVSMHGGKYQLTFDGAKFDEGDNGCVVKLYAIEGEAAAEQPAKQPLEAPVIEPVVRDAVKNADGSITLAFTSDVHHNGVNNNLDVWLSYAEAEVGYIDAMGFCGDMGSAYLSGAQYWDAVQNIIDYMDNEQVAAGKIGDAIYTTGNHEWFPTMGGNYAVLNSNPAAQRINLMGEGIRTEDYIIYCFGAGEIARTFACDFNSNDIAALDEYLSTAPSDIPIFILTHFPLHMWVGATSTRYAAHAGELIDVLNKYPNVVLLWGHNHSEFDENYYTIRHAGDEIVINPAGDVRTLNFDYLTAGVTSDAEYTGPSGGSKWTLNKGLIVTIGADGSLEYDYYSLDGHVMEEEGPYLVQFRAGLEDYPTIEVQYVEAGKAAAAPEAPVFDGYEFTGWDTDFSNVTHPLTVTAKYKVVVDMTPITVTPNATVGGEQLVMTAVGVSKQLSKFDLASIGYGTGLEYGFWFDHDGGTFSFNQDVTLLYQGAPKAQLEAGKVYKIADGYNGGSWSEMYVQLDDGNMLMILDMDNPGNFASVAADTPISAFPGTTGMPDANAVVSAQKVMLDGVEVEVEHYNIGGYNYFKLRDVAAILNGTAKQFSVDYDKTIKTITCVTGEAYAFVGGELNIENNAGKAVGSKQKLLVNGAEQAFGAYNIGGYNFFKLRDLGTALGFTVDFDGTNALIITK